jgi:hypothetical protein
MLLQIPLRFLTWPLRAALRMIAGRKPSSTSAGEQ